MKLADYSMGGWVDERIPHGEITKIIAGDDIDDPAFCEWLSGVVGTYRGMREAFTNAPTRAEEITALQNFRKTADAMLHYLKRGGMPPVAHAEMMLSCWKTTNISIHAEANKAAESLQWLAMFAEVAERRLHNAAAPRGAKEDHRRAILYSKVCERLRGYGLTAARARALAAEILVLCRVEMPEDERRLRRLDARGAELR